HENGTEKVDVKAVFFFCSIFMFIYFRVACKNVVRKQVAWNNNILPIPLRATYRRIDYAKIMFFVLLFNPCYLIVKRKPFFQSSIRLNTDSGTISN
ncbi:hypothetical protein, partial [Bittarella massiliensis (ex Durand et al. 2017)]